NLHNELNSKNEELANLHNELNSKNGELDKFNSMSSDEIIHLKQELENLKITKKELLEKFAREEERSKNAGADAARFSGELDNIKDRMSKLTSTNITLESEKLALSNALQVLRDDLQSKQTIVTVPVEKIKTIIEQDPILLSRLESLENDNNNLSNLNSTLDSELNDLNALLAEKNAEYSSLELKVEMIQEQLGQKDVQISENIEKINELETALASQPEPSAVDEDTEDKINELNEKIKKNNNELNITKNKLSSAQMEIASKNLELSQLKGAKNSLQQEINKLTKQLSDVEQIVPEDTAVDDKLLEEVAILESKIKKQEDIIYNLEADVEENKPLLDSLTEQLEQRELANNKLEKRIRMLATQLKETESDSVAWDMELKFRDAKIDALEEEINELREKLR
ncbi:MAG: hypothetical protein JXR91_07145, partial [Deltaproteobacteria bacterium]|nr:hypothetical protein [Deltaproteobacteria bacterium]